MLFIKDLNIFHIDGKEIPCITALGAPNVRYPGAPGVLYMDTGTGCLYKCTAANTRREEYTWQPVGDVDASTLQQAVAEYLAEHPTSGGGITSAAAALLITILQNAVFTTNQTGNIAALQQALASGSDETPAIPDTPDGPDGPDEPVVTDDITVSNGIMTIVTVGSEITVSDGVMTIA